MKKTATPHHTDDQIRQIMLEYFYRKNNSATSILSKKSGAAVTISVARKELKASFGLAAQQVISNLTYLLSQGWVEEKPVAKSFATPRGGIVPAVTNYYIITAAGIDKIAGPSSFTRDRFDGIRIEATGQNVITLGDGNRVNARFASLGEELAKFRNAVKTCDSLNESGKLELVINVNALQDQLASPYPNTTIVKELWKTIKASAIAAGLVDSVLSISELIGGSFA